MDISREKQDERHGHKFWTGQCPGASFPYHGIDHLTPSSSLLHVRAEAF
jgi:hypothetical protein